MVLGVQIGFFFFNHTLFVGKTVPLQSIYLVDCRYHGTSHPHVTWLKTLLNTPLKANEHDARRWPHPTLINTTAIHASFSPPAHKRLRFASFTLPSEVNNNLPFFLDFVAELTSCWGHFVDLDAAEKTGVVRSPPIELFQLSHVVNSVQKLCEWTSYLLLQAVKFFCSTVGANLSGQGYLCLCPQSCHHIADLPGGVFDQPQCTGPPK